MVSEAFVLATYRYRARGGKLYLLAVSHGISPSVLSATLRGVRRADDDPRLVAIGEQLGLTPNECFAAEPEEQAASLSSTMPDGLEKRIGEDEFVDLVAFLASLKEVPKPSAQ